MNGGRESRIEPTYRLHIPGVLLPSDARPDDWHAFIMSTDELLKLHRAISDELGLGGAQ